MTNIGAIKSRHTKTYGVTKNHGLQWKFVTPCCQTACHVIITWKTESLFFAKAIAIVILLTDYKTQDVLL